MRFSRGPKGGKELSKQGNQLAVEDKQLTRSGEGIKGKPDKSAAYVGRSALGIAGMAPEEIRKKTNAPPRVRPSQRQKSVKQDLQIISAGLD